MRISSTIRRSAQLNARGLATHFGDRERSWGEYASRIARLASGLSEIGVSPGDRVAMLSLNSDRYLEYFFGVPWAGAVFVPINTRLAPPEIVHWLNDSGASVLFIDDTFLPVLPKIQGELESLRSVVYTGGRDTPDGMLAYEGLVEGRTELAPRDRGGDELAGLFYTGGTTGRSKGVMLSHRNLLLNALQFGPQLNFRQDSTYLHAAPMFHLANGAATFCITTAGGASTVIPAFEPKATLQAIQERHVSVALLVPTMVNMVIHHPDVESYDLSCLRDVLYGASPMPESVIAKAMQLMPGVRWHQAYGQTEAAPVLTVLPPERHVLDGPMAGKLKSAGVAVPGVDIAILDENDVEVPRGSVGEICARGENVMLGYRNQPELSEKTLRNGWLHTGDGGRMDEDGFVFIVDRVKDMIVSGGENVYSAEVENAIYEHPAVAECAVIGVPDEKWGERVHAVVRCKDGQSLGEADLIAHCHERIAGYKCPRSVEFFGEPLPLSGAGKILKTELRRPHWEGRDRQVN
jgi:long-chain acyl-CoA synthetase